MAEKIRVRITASLKAHVDSGDIKIGKTIYDTPGYVNEFNCNFDDSDTRHHCEPFSFELPVEA